MSNPNPPVVDPAQLAQAVSEVKQTAPANGGIPLEVKLPTGQVYRGTTPQEVLDQLVQAQTEASRTIESLKLRNTEFETRLQELTAPKPSESDAAQQKKINERYQTWATNPTEATKQDLADLLGVPADRVVDLLKKTVIESTTGSAAQEFMQRYPNFPNNQQSANLMKQRVAQKFGVGIEAATADNLELTFAELVREGQIVPEYMPAAGINNPYQAIPSLRGSSAPQNPINDVMSQFGNMSLDQMKATIERLSQMGGQR